MPVYQEVTVLLSLTRWMEMVLVHKCFMRYSNFAQKLNSQLWMETRLMKQATVISFSYWCFDSCRDVIGSLFQECRGSTFQL